MASSLARPGDIYLWGAQYEDVERDNSPPLPHSATAVHAPRFDYDPVTHAPRGC